MDEHSARDEVMRQWVRQPPVGPNMQYLRDAEWEAAGHLVGRRGDVLDVASEARVTDSLDGETLTRIDFSQGASQRAADILEDVVDRFETTTPSNPRLPFDDDAFDAAVSIGPYDWKFLDVETLTTELNRVVDSAGRVVVSVPTPRSPYAANGKSRYYEPAELRAVFAPDWRFEDSELIFQYPRTLHTTINRLPPPAQRAFVSIADTLSDLLTAAELWNVASYLVVSATPIGYEAALRSAMESLFRPTSEDGFWDEAAGTFIRALRYRMDEGRPVWSPDDSTEWRYAPFALVGILRWRTSGLGESTYDDQLREALDYFATRVTEDGCRQEMPSYGLGPLIGALALASTVFEDREYRSLARDLYAESADGFEFSHPEDTLYLYGWSYLYEVAPEATLLEDIRDGAWQVNERLSSEGLFSFAEGPTRRHQNQMYVLWALCRAIAVTGATGYLDNAERVLTYTVENRMRDDGAFIWEDVPPKTRLAGALDKQLSGRPPYWEYLYECHQTFFVNAVAHYYEAGGETDFDAAVGKAMAWIFGDNELGVDLVDVAGIGVPMRHLTTDGNLAEPYFVNGVRDQRYKGTYEVGSYVMALTHLLDGTI